ncbi:hypothetical protein LTR10_015771 [Elasticomyces elasticus]|uniref:Uncharacterized protein n=1 Tax=Exophiala sideris TaxID=1016849 RepID=A0ABR0IYC7_9EURO|nr:hypothetical protein LTR10_015771 [Elasticomyces elasticus]KAK5022557.1 hypothetical protein LTS07_010003 [Exophiala sideris]KAK5028085.1 hypothetical protein LTR13_009314 [Exophiala sideris]KAK5051826.1 hypothetical protein LTR69_010117 [Exophiala sideris]KAK5177842.1 hypothetical protein LTR44_009607 [Eurotiomycetes sp. CCFEE 6388]
MSKTNSALRQRAASATPQKARQIWKNVVDLTDDPWAPTYHKPTPLSPSFNPNPSLIVAPQDVKSSPAYIFQQLALAKNRANVRPSFSSTIQFDDDSGDDASEAESNDKENTPTPKQSRNKDRSKQVSYPDKEEIVAQEEPGKKVPEEAKLKSKSRKKEKSKPALVGESKTSTDSPNKKTKKEKTKPQAEAEDRAEDKKSRKEFKQETQEDHGGKSRKRKRTSEDDDSKAAEATAIAKLRQSLPTNRISRVAKQLKQEIGCDPTELTVLLTAAGDTIIDLARQQVRQTELSYQTIQGELLRMLKEQKERLEMLETQTAFAVGDDEGSLDTDDDQGSKQKHDNTRGRQPSAGPGSTRRRASTVGPTAHDEVPRRASECATQ